MQLAEPASTSINLMCSAPWQSPLAFHTPIHACIFEDIFVLLSIALQSSCLLLPLSEHLILPDADRIPARKFWQSSVVAIALTEDFRSSHF